MERSGMLSRNRETAELEVWTEEWKELQIHGDRRQAAGPEAILTTFKI